MLEHDHGVDCSDAVHTMYHYIDGEIDDARRTQIAQHLESCLPCFEAFDFEAELRQLIAQRCRDHAPETLLIRIQETIRIERNGGGTTPI